MAASTRIADVRTHLLEHRLHDFFESSFSRFEARHACLVEVVAEDGTSGWGECLGPMRLNAAVVAAMRPLLLGQDALDHERLWLHLYSQFRDQGQRGLVVTALSGIEIALWDLKGKRFEAPVHQLLGGAFRKEVPAYATGAFRRMSGDRPAYLAEETAGYVREGFSAVKIKIGYGVEEDLAAIRAVREAIGPKAGFMIDANHGYDALEAVALGRAAAACDIGWFEEPVVPEDLEGYRAVRAGQPIPVAGGETWFTRWGFRDVMTSRLVDILQPDVCGVGGLSEACRIAGMASAFGLRLVPHVWGTGVALAAALQYLAVLPPVPPRHESREPLLEFDRTDNPFRQAVLTAPIEHREGRVAVPEGPGLGIEVERAALERFKAREA
ncbi:D-galactarolactone cycloisomerase [Tistlia consotensis]|uniref:D-galactarolactone cycloisomerase n=1 Tax=Tistlia consotensis USBA 355 TaxID=560819 RepID=A0A1Y6CT36_9PROT|nr:mandelate racemase/muconate lactonizing enzyme family protein [Tistlia consotensis]SMF76044.1 D-galactarolactone cycloisomerase [Tistlia consotensis USBA 355]SNS12028.1 D-galactarolactone cycloisomerase [Tistlia consotensis]